MANPTFDSFSLQDDNFITTNLEYRTIPVREITLEAISRKPGKKFLSEEFGERRIKLTGFILGDDSDDLISHIDDLHSGVTRKRTGTLVIDTGRSIAATVALVAVADPHYSQSMVPMEIEFVAAEPFFLGTEQTAETSVPAGTAQTSISTTISGSIFAEPQITYYAGGAPSQGKTNIYKIVVSYSTGGDTVTWSGGNDTLSYNDFVKFDYANQLILEGTTEIEAAGVFSRFEPGTTALTLDLYSTTTSTTTSVSTSTSLTTTSSSSSTTFTGTSTSISTTTTSSSTSQSTSTSTSSSVTETSTSTSRSTSTSTTTTLAPKVTIVYSPRYL